MYSMTDYWLGHYGRNCKILSKSNQVSFWIKPIDILFDKRTLGLYLKDLEVWYEKNLQFQSIKNWSDGFRGLKAELKIRK